MKWEGNLFNRIEENGTDSIIAVGTGATEYWYTDRTAYEVTAVRDQKHVTVRELTPVKKDGAGAYSNEWELKSDATNREMDLVKRGKSWYTVDTVTKGELDALKLHRKENGGWYSETEEGNATLIRIVLAGFDIDKIMDAGKQTRYHKKNIRFGKASYYYDYEF